MFQTTPIVISIKYIETVIIPYFILPDVVKIELQLKATKNVIKKIKVFDFLRK